MVPHFHEEARVDLVVRQVRVAAVAARRRGGAAATSRETHRAAQPRLIGKHPVKPVERAFVLRRVVLESPHDARRDGALRGTVRPVQENQPIRPPFAPEVLERAVDLLLHELLTDERFARRLHRVEERQVEEIEARLLAPGPLDARLSVVIEHVAQVATGVARVARGIGAKEREVLAERKQPALVLEIALDSPSDLMELVENAPLRHVTSRRRSD